MYCIPNEKAIVLSGATHVTSGQPMKMSSLNPAAT